MRDKVSQATYLPAILFGFAYLTAPYQNILPAYLSPILEQGPYWGLALIMILSAIFNRAKLVLLSLLLTLVYHLQSTGQIAEIATGSNFVILQFGLTALIPINFALISYYQERSISSFSSFRRAGLIGLQIAALFWIIKELSSEQLSLIARSLAYPLFLSPENWPPFMPALQISFCIATVSIIVILVITIQRNNPISQSIFGTTIACYLILYHSFPSNIENAFVISAVILLANGLFRDYYDMAYKDELTGLPQRLALNENLQSLGKKYSIAMLDVDFFKNFNNTHGHDIGDQVLQMVAGQIRKVQGGGKAYRYGGEEFTVVFAGKDVEHAAYHLELVRKSIEEYALVVREQDRNPEEEKLADKSTKKARKRGSFREAKKTVSVTISIGVADKVQPSEQGVNVLKRADDALYKAKETGRNKVAIDHH